MFPFSPLITPNVSNLLVKRLRGSATPRRMSTRNDNQEQHNSGLSELALALGLVRMLTLLPLHSEALELVEAHIANAYELIAEARLDVAQP